MYYFCIPLLASGAQVVAFLRADFYYFSQFMKRIILFFPVFILLVSQVHKRGRASTRIPWKLVLFMHWIIRQIFAESLIDEQITDREIKSQLSEWYPQINFSGNYQHNFQKPVSIFNGAAAPIGTIINRAPILV